jgi:DNA helicase IV
VVHVGTLPRFKGLEYERVLIAGLSDRVPLTRPLLYMVATRARESLMIFWEGEPSHLLASESAGPLPVNNA